MDYYTYHTQLKAQLRGLEHQAVRDLAWCCLSPHLLSGLVFTQNPAETDTHLWPWLYEIDHQPEPLLDLLNQRKSTRLGLYYETLWQFYFLHHPEWELLAYNQQIYHQGTTLGAFDFLCRRNNEYWHWETAVKFYLCGASTIEAAKQWHEWVGPNNSDRLDLKLTHLQQHQLTLTQNPVARDWLYRHFSDAAQWRSALCLQGYFFQANETQNPSFANTRYCRGQWLTLEQFVQQENNFAETLWLLLDRHLWLSPAQATHAADLLNTTQLKSIAAKHCGEQLKPLLVTTMRDWGNLWQEEKRYFLMPNQWPQVIAND